MRKFASVIFIIVFTFISTSVPANANSTVRVGDSCKIAGSKTTTDQGFTLACIKSGSKLVWSKSSIASADFYLQLFMNSPGIDCSVILYSKSNGIGDNGLSPGPGSDFKSICSPASKVYEVRFDNSDRIGKRSQTYLYVNTNIMNSPRFAREGMEKRCSRAGDQDVEAVFQTPDTQFVVIASDGLGTAWAAQAVKVIEESFGGLDSCAFLKAIPDFGKTVYRTAAQSAAAAKNKKATPTPKPTTTKPTPAKTEKATQDATSQNVVVGTVCSKPGATKNVKGKQYACILKGKKLEWILISGGSTSQDNANPIVSEADKLKNQGCRSFPPAIVQLQNASGSTYNKAFVSAQEATFYINDAARLESKYQGLDNAQRIIAQYVQDVGWLGKGYVGDINTVRTALATFNMACNSNLKIG
jgi:cell division septation protein DedD